jgi:protein SCO1/2
MTPRDTAFRAGCMTAVLCLVMTSAFAVDRPNSTGSEGAAESNGLPGDSLYRLPVALMTEAGTSIKLSSLRGKPLIVTMFYSRCAGVCPLLTVQLQRIVKNLTAKERALVQVLMVSFDSTRDTSAALAEFTLSHQIDKKWLIVTASKEDIRSLASALGIQYRELDHQTFNHTSIISLIDRDGTVRARTSDLNDLKGDFMAAIRHETAGTDHAKSRLPPGSGS